MGLLKRESAWTKEYRQVWRREQRFLERYETPAETALERKLDAKIPPALRETIHGAFVKAFEVVFKKGDTVIRKAGRQESRKQDYMIRAYLADRRESRRNLRAFRKAAAAAGRGNVALSGAAGVGMGLFGVALPDIPLFTGLLLKSIYETAETFGFPCDEEKEKIFALRLIETALSGGAELREGDRRINEFLQTDRWPDQPELEACIRAAARKLSQAVVYGKFLQNIPVAGAAGGAKDAVCLRRVQQYAAIKYQKRFLIRRRTGG